MKLSNIVGIIADDLTGANDTALQFKKCVAETKILLNPTVPPVNDYNTEVWAISTESRNVAPEIAQQKIKSALKTLNTNLNLEHFYKKIDSTIRGNIAVETLTMLEELDYDVAIIIPAFPTEGRITVGGYHLSKCVPIGRTEMARDPHSPITESHVPTLFKTQLGPDKADLVATLDLKTIMNGAGPILVKINELVKQGKKLIVADAVSLVDIEQIVLAINKSSYKILPAGTASTGRALAKQWLEEQDGSVECEKITVPKLPKLIVSGSATQINSTQIEHLEQSYDYDNLVFLSLTPKNIIDGVTDDVINHIVDNLMRENTVIVHSSKLLENFDGFSDDSLKEELTRPKFAIKITDYLAELTKRVQEKINIILILLGGETSFKCCNAISATELTMLDEVAPAIALCHDEHNQLIITKSGNLGTPKTLIDILHYIEKHEV